MREGKGRIWFTALSTLLVAGIRPAMAQAQESIVYGIYDTQAEAQQGLSQLQQLQQQGNLAFDYVALAAKDMNGQITVLRNARTGAAPGAVAGGAAIGAAIGLIGGPVGVLIGGAAGAGVGYAASGGARARTGLAPEEIERIKAGLRPGGAVLFVATSPAIAPAVASAMKLQGAVIPSQCPGVMSAPLPPPQAPPPVAPAPQGTCPCGGTLEQPQVQPYTP
jgi:uncharacterized membrane protein